MQLLVFLYSICIFVRICDHSGCWWLCAQGLCSQTNSVKMNFEVALSLSSQATRCPGADEILLGSVQFVKSTQN